MLDWIEPYEELLRWLVAISGGIFVVTLLLLPLLIIFLPQDYFTKDRREPVRRAPNHPLITAVAVPVKNVIGLLFIVAGLAMLVLPGQGLLSILLGIILMNFPGKYALERRLVAMERVRRSLNWIRRKVGRAPLRFPSKSPE